VGLSAASLGDVYIPVVSIPGASDNKLVGVDIGFGDLTNVPLMRKLAPLASLPISFSSPAVPSVALSHLELHPEWLNVGLCFGSKPNPPG
jgi:hypothetical protein